jgi:hypothetical protein
LSPQPSSSDRRAPAASATAWSGPVLLVLGAAAIAKVLLSPSTSHGPLAWWIETSALAPVRVLPLFGLGVLLTLIDFRRSAVALLLFGLGIFAGFFAHERFATLLAGVPQAAGQEFLSGPVSCLAVGLALAPNAKLRGFLVPLAAAVAGAMLALAIKVTDPSLHDATVSVAGLLIGLWIVAGVALTLRGFRRTWFTVAARIYGSWLIAIGLLYGGASLVPKRQPPLPPAAATMQPPDMSALPDETLRIPDSNPSPEEPAPVVPPRDIRR